MPDIKFAPQLQTAPNAIAADLGSLSKSSINVKKTIKTCTVATRQIVLIYFLPEPINGGNGPKPNWKHIRYPTTAAILADDNHSARC